MNYSLVIRNNLSKSVEIINKYAEDVGIFLTFNDIDFSDYADGEYTLFVIENEAELPIYVQQNNIKKSEITTNKYILVINGDIITSDGSVLLIDGDEYQISIPIIATELMRIGDYVANNKQYNTERVFKQYGK